MSAKQASSSYIEIQRRTLERAQVLAGSAETLAEWVRIPAAELRALLNGEGDISAWVFLRAVDIINDIEGSAADGVTGSLDVGLNQADVPEPTQQSAKIYRIR